MGEKPSRKWTNVQTSYLGLMIKGCGEINREMRERWGLFGQGGEEGSWGGDFELRAK